MQCIHSGACGYSWPSRVRVYDGSNQVFAFPLTRSLGISVLGCDKPVDGIYSISSQQDLDAKLQNCTSIQYPIYFASNYTGSFVLPNTTTWVSGLQTSWSGTQGIFDERTLNLTSIVGEGVTWIDDGLYIGNATCPYLSHSIC
jgi:hypothetical protein